MGITEELLKSKKNVAPDSNGNMGITQELLLRRQAGLRPQVSPSENVGYDISMGGLLAQRNAANMEEKINRGLRENAVSPTKALEQLRGYTFSPAPSITLPTAQEMDALDLQQTLQIADQKKAELDQQIAAQKAVQQKNNAGAAPAYAAISGTQQLRPAQISAPKSAAAGQNVKPVEQTDQEKAFEQASQRIWGLQREKNALSYIQDNAGKTYDDNFIGQFGASYTLGRLTQDESLAWNKYLDNPTEANRAYAEAIGQVISAFQLENQEVLADDATLPWVSQSLANYLPQFADQVKYGAVGAVSGGTVGSVIPVLGTAAGIKAGITAASGVYSYQTMRGAAFKTLLDLGVPEDVARAAANDEAVVSSAIEMADTGIDLLTLGGKELIAAMTGGAAKTAAKKGAESAVKKFLKALGKYGLNVAGEWTEEATQQAVSIANAKRVETGDMNGIFDLAGDAAKVFGKALWDKEDKNRAEILEAGEQGAIVAGLMGPLQAGFNQLAYTGVTALDNKASADYGQQLRSKGLESVTIEAGLKFDEGSRIRQMAEAMQQKQQNGQEVTDVELGDLYRQIKIGARQEYQYAVQQAQNETAVQQQAESGIMLPTADEMDAMLGVRSVESSLRQSGMEAGANEQAIESAERISTALGRDIQFFRQEEGERGTVNGFFDPNTGTIYVNSQSQNPVAQIIAHELTHSVEMADSYQELQSVVMDQLQKDGIDINRRRQEIQALYERNNVELKDQAEIDQEIVAQFVETRLLTDEKTILNLTRTNRSLMERVLDWINRTLQKLGVRKTTERDTLEKARDLYARALQESREQEQNEAAAQQQKEVRDVVQYLRNALASGEITESEYDEAMESVMEQASLAGVNLLDQQMSISEDEIPVKKQFSLSEPIEQTKDLLALHNLSQENLRGAFKLGGFPMPSIAVIRDTMQHDRYGDITLVFGRSTVDPQMNMYNRVYGGDAWTPSFPRVEYQADQKALDRIDKRIDQVLPREMRNQFGRPLSLDTDNVEDNLNRWNGNLEEAYKDNDILRYVFVKEKDPSFEAQRTTEKLGKRSGHDDAIIISLGDFLGYDKIREMREQGYRGFEENEALRDEMIGIINQVYEEQYGDTAKNLYSEMGFSDYDSLTADIYRYFRNGKKANQIINAQETRAAVNQAINQEEYLQWVRDLFRDVVKNVGIRNEKDRFTPSGNRRSFNALHYELTLENAVRVMRKDIQKGGGSFFGGGAIWGVATKDYSSINELRQDKNRIQVMDEKEYEDLRGQYTQRLVDICSEIIKPGENRFIAMDGAADAIIDALRTKKTRAAIDRELRSYSFLNVKHDTAQKVLDLVSDIKKMPTEYFEAKPQRAVYFSEVLAAVVPDDVDQDIKDGLSKERVKTLEYKAGDTDSRMKAVNSVEGAKFSISETYERDIDTWDAAGRPDGEVFILGETGDVLQGLGAMEQDIYMRSEKVNKILQEHQEMTLEEIKRIPEVLDDPVLIVKSTGQSRGGQNTRLVITGALRAQNGKPVLATLDLRPVENTLVIDDMQKVNTAFGRSNAGNYIPKSEVLYADEKRTIPLLKTMGLQSRPIELQRYGSMGSISYNGQNVNLHGIPFQDVVRTSEQEETGNSMRYSIADDKEPIETGITLPTAESESQLLRDQLPVKAKNYLQRAERSMMNTIGQSLSIPYRARRVILTAAVREMSEEYLSTGKISEKTRRSLFEEAYEAGIVQDREFLDQYQGLRDYLRDTTLRISKEDSADIPDFNDYRRRNFGRLNISTQGGTNIDQVYKELSEIWPELFNEQRESTPSDQLNRISEVVKNFQVTERSLDEYYGENAAEFKRYAYHDFSAAIDEQLHELQAVRRYQEQNQRQQSMEEQKQKTIEEVVKLWDQFKAEKQNYEKVAAKNLLTDEDERLVGQLLRGEITEQVLDSETNNVKGILAVYESKKEFDRIAKQLRAWNADRRNTLKKLADQYLETANGWKDKKSGILYSRETMERNIRDIVPDEALAQSIIDEYFTPVHKGTAFATRMKNTFRQRVKSMNLSRDIAKGNIVSEAHAVQLLGEAEDNIRMLEKSKWTKERDGKTIEEWRKVVSDLWKENPNLDQKKIRDAVDSFRKIYDALFQQMNEVRVRNGYEPINYRSGYFPHFQPGDGDGILAAFGRAMGISTDVTALPTAINGLTHTFRPGIQWFGNAQERLGFNTAYDAVEGFDKYIEGVADVIYQTDNIQKLRQLANQVRYRTTSEGIRKQVDAVLADESLSEIDKQNRIEKIYESGKFTLSNFVVELEEYTNLLANKKSRHDRSVETDAGRAVYNLVKTLEGRVAANMVSINPASWLTNFIPLAQGNATLGRGRLLKGMWDTLRSYKENDGFVEQSTFLTNRRGSDPLVKSWQKGEMPSGGVQRTIRQIGEAVGKFGDIAPQGMELIDNFVSDSLVRARYEQNLAKGMSETTAMDEADAWTAGVMADRSKGSMPTLFMRKNPLTKLVTQFQLEVNNQLSYLFKDIPRETKKAGIKVLTWALVKFAVGAWLYDEIYEYLIGRRPALDPIGILNDTVGDLTGWEIPNLVQMGVDAISGEKPDFQTEREGIYSAGINLAEATAEQLPFVGGLLGGGRLPISSAIPDVGTLWRAASDETMDGQKRAEAILEEMANTVGTYLVLPYGGGQLKKIIQTAKAVAEGGRYYTNNEGEKQLQYPVFSDEPLDAAGNLLWGSVFGPTSLKTGMDWINQGFGSFSVNETIAYEAMKEAGTDDRKAFQVLQDYKAAGNNAEKRQVLRAADISGDAKAAFYYQLMASDKERENMDILDEAGEDMGSVVDMLLDIKDQNAVGREETEVGPDERFDSETMNKLNAAGLSEYDAVMAMVQKESIWADQDLTTTERRTEFSRWMNQQDYSDKQKATLTEITIGAGTEATNQYSELIARGIDDDIAGAIASDISRLEPVDGAETVSREQKRQVVFDRIGDQDEQLMALETINTESQQEKFVQANKEGVSPEKYASALEEIQQYDTNGNGSLTQEEVENALNSIGRSGLVLPGGDGDFTLSTRDKAVIWQLTNKSWKPDNNPFDVEVGKAIYNAMH